MRVLSTLFQPELSVVGYNHQYATQKQQTNQARTVHHREQ